MVSDYLRICLIVGCFLCASSYRKDYTGYQVWRIYHQTKGEENYIEALIQDEALQLDMWGEVDAAHSADVEVPPTSRDTLAAALEARGISWDVTIPNLQREIDRETEETVEDEIEEENRLYDLLGRRRRRKRALSSVVSPRELFYNFSCVGHYSRHARILEWMKAARHIHPRLIKVIRIGNTTQGRPMEVIKIGHSDKKKPSIFIDANIHAREWITSATAVYIINQLITEYNQDTNTTSLINHFNWYILPVANPDGFEYTHTTDRLWRKTRSKKIVAGRLCYGVDPNRNFDFHWLDCCHLNTTWTCRSLREAIGCASTNPCSSLYAGPRAFSEPETTNMANFMLKLKPGLKLYVTLHSYTQKWLTTWSFTRLRPNDYLDQLRVAVVGKSALKDVHGTDFQIGSPAHILYAAAGGSFDWAKGVAGVKYSYGLELRDNGYHGFILPRDQIIPSGQEVWAGLKAAAMHIMEDK